MRQSPAAHGTQHDGRVLPVRIVNRQRPPLPPRDAIRIDTGCARIVGLGLGLLDGEALGPVKVVPVPVL